MSNRLVPLPTKPHVILPKRRAVPPLSGAPPKNHDVAAVLFTLALVGAAWPYRHVAFLATRFPPEPFGSSREAFAVGTVPPPP